MVKLGAQEDSVLRLKQVLYGTYMQVDVRLWLLTEVRLKRCCNSSRRVFRHDFQLQMPLCPGY